MQAVLAGYDRLAVPSVYRDLSTSRLLVMEEIQGIPIKQAPAGPERIEAARQLLESYYKQIIVDGFFHADPHPGNLMWWKNRIYFLDFGMVGAVGADFREHLLLLLMALWQDDAAFVTDVTLMMTGAIDRSDHVIARIAALYLEHRLIGYFFGRNEFHLAHVCDRIEFAFCKQSVLARIDDGHSNVVKLFIIAIGFTQYKFPRKLLRFCSEPVHRFSQLAPFVNRLTGDVVVTNHRRRLKFFNDWAIRRASHQEHQTGVRKTHRGLGQ